MTIQKLAGMAGLTPRPCLERVRRLEAAGIIAGYQAVLALEKLSKPVTIFAEIIMDKQGRSDRLEKRLAGIEEIVECWEVSGDLDYLARFVCSDLARYETLTTDLIDDADSASRGSSAISRCGRCGASPAIRPRCWSPPARAKRR